MEIVELAAQVDSLSPVTQWQERQLDFQQKKEAFLLTRNFLEKEQNSLHQERLFYEQNRLLLGQQIQEQWRQDSERKIQLAGLRQRLQDAQEFAERLSRQREDFLLIRQALLDRLAALREQRLLVMELTDFRQKQEGFLLVQAAYLELQQQLREEQQLWHEQRVSYRQQRFDRQADLYDFQATKTPVR